MSEAVARSRPARTGVLRRAVRTYRRSGWKWRHVDNLVPWYQYRLHRPPLDHVQRRIVQDLRTDGIAITSVEELGLRSLFDEMVAEVDHLRESAAPTDGRAVTVFDEHTMKLQLLGHRPVLDPQSPFVRTALHPRILYMVDEYMRMFAQLRSFNVWQNRARTDAGDSETWHQDHVWHRDRDDRHVLKTFLYLSHVTDGAGPFMYVPGTHPYGPLSPLSKAGASLGAKPSDEEIARAIPRAAWRTATGPPGTLVLADTRGFHKGGRARGRDRLLFTSLYVSKASRRSEEFARAAPVTPPADRAAAFAITP